MSHWHFYKRFVAYQKQLFQSSLHTLATQPENMTRTSQPTFSVGRFLRHLMSVKCPLLKSIKALSQIFATKSGLILISMGLHKKCKFSPLFSPLFYIPTLKNIQRYYFQRSVNAKYFIEKKKYRPFFHLKTQNSH